MPSRLAPTPPKAGHSLQVTLDLRPAAGERKGAARGHRTRARRRQTGDRRARSWRSTRATAKCSRSARYPSVRPEQVRQTADANANTHELAGGSGPASGRADRPRGQRRLPDGLDVQADHRDGGARSGRDHARRRPRRGPVHLRLDRAILQRGMADYGAVGLVEALKVSSDTYFFEVGERANAHGDVDPEHGAQARDRASPPASTCRASSRAWSPTRVARRTRTRSNYACTREHHGHPCGIVGEPGAPWSVGDNMHLAVGQGDLLTDPLQMAVAYSTLANAYRNGGDGTVVTPHLGKEIDEANGALVQSLSFPHAPRAPQRRRPEPRDGRHPRRRQRAAAAPPRTCGPAGTRNSTPSTARPAPPSTTARKTSPGTCATSATPRARS